MAAQRDANRHRIKGSVTIKNATQRLVCKAFFVSKLHFITRDREMIRDDKYSLFYKEKVAILSTFWPPKIDCLFKCGEFFQKN
jgi:hypothetical protein